MQRYAGVAWNEPRADGEWVKYSDAMEEKIKYGRASFDNGFSAGAAKEREEIVKELRSIFYGYDTIGAFDDAINMVKSRGASEPRWVCDKCGKTLGVDSHAAVLCDGHYVQEPRCTCEVKIPNVDYHSPDCPCYKPREPQCTCLEEDRKKGHDPICPCYKPVIAHNPCMCPDCRELRRKG